MISVVTLTFQNFADLKATLRSLEGEDAIESVVVNGGQCSETKEFLKFFRGSSISEKDDGISDAFNKGIMLSKGEFVHFLNSGDILIDSRFYTEAVEVFNAHPEADFVYTGIIFGDQLCGPLLIPARECSLGRGTPYPHQGMIYRKRVFDRLGLFDKNFRAAMDFEHLCRMESAGMKGLRLSVPAGVYMDGGGVSTQREWVTIQESFRALSQHHLWTFRLVLDFFRRVTLFTGRQVLSTVGLASLLKRLKKQKYQSVPSTIPVTREGTSGLIK